MMSDGDAICSVEWHRYMTDVVVVEVLVVVVVVAEDNSSSFSRWQ